MSVRDGAMLLTLQLLACSPSCSRGQAFTSSYTLPAGIVLTDGAEYDYIVVGAGAAGSAAAARLALAGEDVLLLEAGGDPDLLSRIPEVAMGLLGSPLDWQYKTISNNVSCLSAMGRACRFSRGKCLGGSTSINYMLYTRGNRKDYDDFNISGWGWNDLEPYFLRYEGLQILDQLPRSSRPYHNTTGLMKLEFFDDPENPWHARIVRGFKRLRFRFNADVNGASQIGVTRATGYVFNGERMGTARAYLSGDEVKRRLKVAKNAFCTGVILDDDKIATGVTVVQGLLPTELKIYAKKEVILSAGTVGTPQILQLSGIGPAAHLERMGIPVVSDLPVGDNLSDHVLPLILVLVDGGEGLVESLVGLIGTAKSAVEFLFSRDGPLASNGLTDINVFANTSCYNFSRRRLDSGPGCELPTLQVIHAYVDRYLVTAGKPLFQNGIYLDDNAVDQIAAINARYAVMVLSPVVLQPYSRGQIRLASTRPRDPPAIFPNYLADDRDVEEMLRSIRIIEDLMETPAFRNRGAKIFHLKLPGCPEFSAESRREYWRCYVRHLTYAVFHAVGTCALQTCVDGALRVRGVRRLRVADASVLPALVRGNTAAACVALGERVADFILRKQ